MGCAHMVDKYDKLVRDKIPIIIKQQGDSPKTVTLDDKRYFNALNRKLREELDEYFEYFNIEELADIVEVIHALVKYKGLTLNEFEKIRLKKYDERGSFDARVSLIEVERQCTE